MTTLTIQIQDHATTEISQIVKTRGGYIIADSTDNLSASKQISLNQRLKEAELIKSGAMKALSFDDL